MQIPYLGKSPNTKNDQFRRKQHIGWQLTLCDRICKRHPVVLRWMALTLLRRVCQAVNLRWAYLGIFWIYVDCALIAMSIAAITFSAFYAMNIDSVIYKLKHLDKYQDFYALALERHKFDLAASGVLFLAWIKVRKTVTLSQHLPTCAPLPTYTSPP